MIELLRLILHIVASLFKSRAKLAAEILVLRQQLNVLRRQVSKRPQLSNSDRFLFVWLYRWFPSVLGAIAILRPETIIRWYRTGFRSYWRGRSRNRVGRPRISAELRNLMGAMSRANHLWGAPHILVRDNDCAYGQAFTRRVRAMGIRDRPISPRSPWQNPYVERLIGTLRRLASDICIES